MRGHKRRRKPNLFSSIFLKTLGGLCRKLPLFLVAALAMALLVTLDRVRVTHGIANGSDGATSFEINEEFFKHAHAVDGTLKGWLEDTSRFKYHKFSNRRELLDALAAKAMVVKEESRNSLLLDKQKATERIEKAREELEAAQRKLGKTLKRGGRGQLKKLVEDKQAELTEANAEVKRIDDKIAALKPQLDQDTTLVYTSFRQQLPRILIAAEKRKVGLFDDLLEDSLIDDKNSLHFVYHVFRISSLIIVILSIVFILVMLFQQLPLAGGADTVSEHLKALISMRSAGVGGEIAKTAIVSVTALGVGTAVLMGTNTVSVTPHNPPPIEKGGPKVRDAFLPPVDVSWDPVTKEYLQQLFISNGGSYSPYWKQSVFNGPQEPSVFKPDIEVPPAVVIHTRIPDTAGTQAIIQELKTLVAKLQFMPGVDDLRTRISSIEAQLKASITPGCNCGEALGTISTHLENITKTLGGSVSDQTISKSTLPLLTLPSASPTPGLSPMPSPNPPNTDTVVGALRSTGAALDAIEKELKAMRADGLVNRTSNSGNGLTRAGRFFGSELYAITDQVYQALDEVIKGNSNHSAFMKALESMKAQAPQEKDEFLRSLRTLLTANVSGDQKKSLLKSLKAWERVIVSYARLRN